MSTTSILQVKRDPQSCNSLVECSRSGFARIFILIGGRKDRITIRGKAVVQKLAQRSLEENKWREVPTCLNIDAGKLDGQVIRRPKREEIRCFANEQMIMGLYSR